MLNIKATHRATTAMREAFAKSVRLIGQKPNAKLPEIVSEIADAFHRNAGVYRRPDVSFNITTKTWNQLKQLKAV